MRRSALGISSAVELNSLMRCVNFAVTVTNCRTEALTPTTAKASAILAVLAETTRKYSRNARMAAANSAKFHCSSQWDAWSADESRSESVFWRSIGTPTALSPCRLCQPHLEIERVRENRQGHSAFAMPKASLCMNRAHRPEAPIVQLRIAGGLDSIRKPHV